MLHCGPENHPPYSAKSIYTYFCTHITSQSNFRQSIAGICFNRFLPFIGAKAQNESIQAHYHYTLAQCYVHIMHKKQTLF